MYIRQKERERERVVFVDLHWYFDFCNLNLDMCSVFVFEQMFVFRFTSVFLRKMCISIYAHKHVTRLSISIWPMIIYVDVYPSVCVYLNCNACVRVNRGPHSACKFACGRKIYLKTCTSSEPAGVAG